MFQSDAFNYINVLDKAADASWTRKDLITNNIANNDTPGYKRQDIDFKSLLSKELKHYQYQSLDEKMRKVNMSRLNAEVYTDSAGYSYRLDGNNVDIDTENVELASEQINYEALTSSIDSEFSRMKSALG